MGLLKLEYLPRYTYQDYTCWEGNWELIEGIPCAMSPAPMIYHQNISGEISTLLREAFINCQYCKELFAVDWKIDDETVVCPDNLVICHNETNEKYLTKAPKIIFEILSKSTAKKDKTIKFELYQQEGVEYYVIVDGSEKVAKIYELKDGKYIKMLNATDEVVEFDITNCGKVLFNFKKIWGNK